MQQRSDKRVDRSGTAILNRPRIQKGENTAALNTWSSPTTLNLDYLKVDLIWKEKL